MAFTRFLFAASCLQVVMFAAAQVDCSIEPDGTLCNVEQGCGCVEGVCATFDPADPSSRNLITCEVSLTGTPFAVEDCTADWDACLPRIEVEVAGGCAEAGVGGFCQEGDLAGEMTFICRSVMSYVNDDTSSASSTAGLDCIEGCICSGGTCFLDGFAGLCEAPDDAPCADGTDICDDPHMKGLSGQKIDWSGVDGGWYCLVKDDDTDLHVNIRLTAPLAEEFPDRQLITGLSVISGDHSLVVEVTNPYETDTNNGCPDGMPTPCLANGGLRVTVDGEKGMDDSPLLHPVRGEVLPGGSLEVSGANLPVECWQFGGDAIWARHNAELTAQGRRMESSENFEDWVLSFEHMAAHDWCTEYIAKNGLSGVQSSHAIYQIVTPAVVARLNVGIGHQTGGELDWDGRVLPDLDVWQMDVGLVGLSVDSEALTGILGETARPVYDKDGHAVMSGDDAFRGTVEDYRVSGSLGTDFALLHHDK